MNKERKVFHCRFQAGGRSASSKLEMDRNYYIYCEQGHILSRSLCFELRGLLLDGSVQERMNVLPKSNNFVGV